MSSSESKENNTDTKGNETNDNNNDTNKGSNNENKEIDYFIKGENSYKNNSFSEALHYFNIAKNDPKNSEKVELIERYIKECQDKIKENELNSNTEDDTACENIIKSNDYYAILGVNKDANNDEIKKAYKKMAIKFHPDKNKSSKAEEAFKKIATCYQTLSDPERRKLFDKYGSEEEYREKIYKERKEREEEDFDPYDIFDMFFAGFDKDEVERRRNFFRNRRNNMNDVNVNLNSGAVKYIRLIQLVPVIIMLVNYFLPILFQEAEYFKYEKSVEYPIQKKTHHYHVKYFVNQDFLSKFASRPDLMKVEKDIESGYENYLKTSCDELIEKEQQLKTRLVYYKKGSYNYKMISEEIKKFSKENCKKLEKFKKKKKEIDEETEEE